MGHSALSEGNPARGNLRVRTTGNNGVTAAAMRIALVAALCVGVGACTTTETAKVEAETTAEIGTETKFSEAEYGVPASERVTTMRSVPKGGGYVKIGEPYQIAGKWYTPELDPDYDESGLASWYGANFHGRKTANGEIFDQYHLSAAHPTFPLPSYARVTNQANGRSVLVRVNDRGPFAHNRIIDVSSKAAEVLGFKAMGVAKVNVEYVGPASLDGNDMTFLMASLRMPGDASPTIDGRPAEAGVMLAMNEVESTGVPGVATEAIASQITPVAAPTTAPAAADVVPAVAGAGNLPDVGPVLPERPSFEAGTVQAYAEARISASTEAFSAILDGQDAALTAGDIVGAWKQRHR